MKLPKVIINSSLFLVFLFMLWCIFRITGIMGFYNIPSSAMEPNLKTNSYILVHQIPQFLLSNIEERNKNSIKAMLCNAFTPKIKNNDILVFKYPEGDTISLEHLSNNSYYNLLRTKELELAMQNSTLTIDELKILARQMVWSEYNIKYIPLYRRTTYVKRCVGIGGDTIIIDKGNLWVNGKADTSSYDVNYNYLAKNPITNKQEKECKISINKQENYHNYKLLMITKAQAKCINEKGNNVTLQTQSSNYYSVRNNIFPHDSIFNWTTDFYGPIVVPKKGNSIIINDKNVSLYERLIKTYENDLLENYLNKNIPYTFKMNYYFVMGDNRHNTIDSRFWGFVPQSHVIGKSFFNFNL